MYASGTYEGNGTKLDFKHIPSTLRLIITNTGSSAVSLQEVSVYVSGASASQDRAVASSASEMAFDKTTGDVSLSFSGDTHEKVTTTFEGDDRILDPDEKYTAYSIVLPLSYDDAFKGKAINFNVKADGKEFLAFQLDAEKLAKANGGVCNWVSGKSYSIRLNVGDEAKVSGEIIADNRIEISTDATGTFTLRYEDSDGEPLADYAEICILTAESVAYYEDFINANIAPEAAYAIGVYDASGNRLGSISIAGLKPEYSEPAYSFGLLADVHCQDGGGTESISDFQRALKFFGQRNVALTCICGDITQEGTEYEMNLYR